MAVLSVLLGAGNTTHLNHTLNNRDGRRVALIFNDMSEVNIDADLVRERAETSRSEEKLVEMTNGCIWCILSDDATERVGRNPQAIKVLKMRLDVARRQTSA